MGNYHYKAFISYSHKDHKWGAWLHRRLERYRLPKHLITSSDNGRLKPIFRDREELSAADDLGEKIEQAIAASANLIVICSPHAAKSHWVNQEILSFKRQNRGAKIFSIIVEGEPFSGDEDECMPPALRFQLGSDGELTDEPAEPLAADLRTSGDGKRLGVLKIISGMLGVRLDELVQRDLQRNRTRVTAITATALATVLAMGTLTGFALSARKEADARRDAAEDMIEFMITELKPELEAVGRLKPLAIIGERAAKYYEDQPLTAHNDNALGRRARVFHLIGEIDDKHGDLDKAQARFEEAYASTKALLARDSENADRIFDHAQSAYWAGFLLWKREKYDEVEPYFIEYISNANDLKKLEPSSLRSLQEITYAYTNLGTLLFKQKKIDRAYKLYLSALPAYEEIADTHLNVVKYQLDLGNIYGWLADTSSELAIFQNAMIYRDLQISLYQKLQQKETNSHNIEYEYNSAVVGKVRLLRLLGNTEQATILVNNGYTDSMKLYKSEPLNSDFGENLLYFLYEKLFIAISSNRKNEATAFFYELDTLQRSLIKSGVRDQLALRNSYKEANKAYMLKFGNYFLPKN